MGGWLGMVAARLIGVSVEDSRERSLFLLTSVRYGGKGVTFQQGATKLLTMKKTESGALFCVNPKLEGLQQESVMAKLQSMDAGSKVWARLQEVLTPKSLSRRHVILVIRIVCRKRLSLSTVDLLALGMERDTSQLHHHSNSTWLPFYAESKLVSRMISHLASCQVFSLQTTRLDSASTRKLGTALVILPLLRPLD